MYQDALPSCTLCNNNGIEVLPFGDECTIINILYVGPTGIPRNVTFSTTARSVDVSWQSIVCIERNGRISGYAVQFQERERAINLSKVVGLNFTATGLTPHTNYTFSVAGVNSNGTGPFTDIVTITTNEDGK